MANVNNGINVLLSSKLLPTGYSKPAFTKIDGQVDNLTFEIVKSTVENVDPDVTFDNIINDASLGLARMLVDWIDDRYLATGVTVTYYAELRDMTSNHVPSYSTDFYINNPFLYILKVTLYVNAVPDPTT